MLVTCFSLVDEFRRKFKARYYSEITYESNVKEGDFVDLFYSLDA